MLNHSKMDRISIRDMRSTQLTDELVVNNLLIIHFFQLFIEVYEVKCRKRRTYNVFWWRHY